MLYNGVRPHRSIIYAAATTAAAVISLAGCGTRVGRIPFSKPGSSSTVLTAKAGELVFWSDLDVAWDGNFQPRYDITVTQVGKVVGTVTCDPLNVHVRLHSKRTNWGTHHTASQEGKMSCRVTLPASGSTKIKASLRYLSRPKKLTVRRLDLVIKQ